MTRPLPKPPAGAESPLVSVPPVLLVAPLLVLVAHMLWPMALAAQVEQEDLSFEQSLIPAEIEQRFEEATALFDTTDQAESLPLFSEVVEALSPLAAGGDEEVLEMLQQALLFRIRGNFNFGEREAVQSDIDQLVDLAPGLQLDRAEVSSRLADLYDSVRNEKVGFLDLTVAPSDARIWVRGEPLPQQTEPHALLAGSYFADIRRPGYAPATLTFEIEPGETVEERLELERTSAVVALRTRPTGAKVLLDGIEVGETIGQAEPDFTPLGAQAARYSPAEFSSETLIDEILPGSYVLEIRKPNFRPFRAQLDITELDDYRFEPVILEAEQGQLILRSLPSDAAVEVNGQRLRPTRGPDGQAQLLLAPGNYRVTVSQGSTGRFEGVVDILDRSSVSLDVKLRPALVLLGILGEDEVAAERLRDEIGDAFRRADNWMVLDRTLDAQDFLQRAGINSQDMRRAAVPGSDVTVDWSALQSAVDGAFGGSAYMIGVLTDDLIASEADLWMFSAEPGPSTPERRRVQLDDDLALPQLALGFRPTLDLERATLGLELIDSELATGPLIAAVVPGSAADRAGLRPGLEIASFQGSVPSTSREVYDALAALDPSQEVTLQVLGSDEILTFTPDRSYTVIDFTDRSLVFPAVFATLNAELERTSEWPRWLLQLNRAALLLRAGEAEEAIRTLRRIEVSTVPATEPIGLGRGSIDYLLGLALTQAGPRYLETAREAFARAAAAEGERLFHNDGPMLQPRAEARLERLGGAPR